MSNFLPEQTYHKFFLNIPIIAASISPCPTQSACVGPLAFALVLSRGLVSFLPVEPLVSMRRALPR